MGQGPRRLRHGCAPDAPPTPSAPDEALPLITASELLGPGASLRPPPPGEGAGVIVMETLEHAQKVPPSHCSGASSRRALPASVTHAAKASSATDLPFSPSHPLSLSAGPTSSLSTSAALSPATRTISQTRAQTVREKRDPVCVPKPTAAQP